VFFCLILVFAKTDFQNDAEFSGIYELTFPEGRGEEREEEI
jgi:hypothetical protein